MLGRSEWFLKGVLEQDRVIFSTRFLIIHANSVPIMDEPTATLARVFLSDSRVKPTLTGELRQGLKRFDERVGKRKGI